MHWLPSCLLLLMMIEFIESQKINSPCKSFRDQSISRCTYIIYCDGNIDYSDLSISGCNSYYNNYKGYRTYDEDYDLSLHFENMERDVIAYKPRRFSSSKVKKITIDKLEAVSVPPEILAFDYMTHFEIINSALETFDLSRFTDRHNLKLINASHNRISSLEYNNPITPSLHSLQVIDFSFNLLQTIPNNYFSRFPNLLHLNLSHNYIEHVEILTFEGLSLLQTLYFSHNNLVSIDHSFARFANLRELLLDGNQIVSLEDSNFNIMTQLKNLNMSSNQISDIDETIFQTLSVLETLDLSHNKLTKLKNIFQNNTNLQELFLSDNNIKTISKGVFSATNITLFRISNNNLSGVIFKDTFEGIKEPDFDLSYNNIQTLDSDVFSSFGSELLHLNLSHNDIVNVSNTTFISTDYIITLDVSYNELITIDGYFNSLSELKHLNLSNNDITKIFKVSFKSLVSLSKLDLSFNPIKSIDDESFNDLRKLETLILSHTHLTGSFAPHTLRGMVMLKNIFLMNIHGTTNYEKYAFSGMVELQTINSSFSGLTTIHYDAFNDTGSIEIMDLSHNLLETFSLDITSISSVKELYLHNNRIQNITRTTFAGLISLVKLTLAFNHIVLVQDNSLSSLSKLRLLDLAFNEGLEFNGSLVENTISLYSLSLKNIKSHYNFTFVRTSSINVIDMSFCDIDNVSSRFIYRLTNITDLNLSSNKITSINKHSFRAMPMLSTLDLSFNRIINIQPGSFIYTNLVNNLNLHGNMISNLQYGVFDGLNNLDKLNLSSNSLSSFEVNLLHNCHAVNTIALDDNIITSIDLDSFQNKNINELSLGGNFIDCEKFIELKNNKYSFAVTAQNLDYHSENINGITCKTLSKNTVVFKNSNDTILPNITAAFDSLSNAMDMFRSAIQHVATSDVNSSASVKKDIDSVLTTINRLVKLYNDSQLLTNDLLQKMIENNEKRSQDTYVKDENENVNENINTPVYVTLGCLVFLSILVIFLSYSYFKYKSKFVDSNNSSSIRHLANEIEME